MKREETELWHHNVVQDLNLPGWWQSVQAPGCGVSHRSCQARPRHINRISPLAGWLAQRALRPFEVTGPLTPLGEAWDLIPLLTHTCQDKNTRIFAYSHIRIHAGTSVHQQTHNLLALNQAPIKYDRAPCPANTHKLQTHKPDLHLCSQG